MFRIGTVARLAQVSIRTLRHYDAIGLLAPAWVDPDTGYRWYGPTQMEQLHRILVLRDLGVPLAEIGDLLGEELTAEQLRGILLLRRAEAHERIESESQRLARVEARIEQLEEHEMESYDIGIKRLDRVRVVAASEDLVGHDEIGPALGRLYPRLHAALGAHRIAFTGVSYAIYDDLDDRDGAQRVTAALPVPDDVTITADGVDTVELPSAERAAATVVLGAPEEQFHRAFEALMRWVDATGDQKAGQERELYLDCDGPRDTWVTELQVVLADQATPMNPASTA